MGSDKVQRGDMSTAFAGPRVPGDDEVKEMEEEQAWTEEDEKMWLHDLVSLSDGCIKLLPSSQPKTLETGESSQPKKSEPEESSQPKKSTSKTGHGSQPKTSENGESSQLKTSENGESSQPKDSEPGISIGFYQQKTMEVGTSFEPLMSESFGSPQLKTLEIEEASKEGSVEKTDKVLDENGQYHVGHVL